MRTTKREDGTVAGATVRRVLEVGVPVSVLEREMHDLGWLGDEVAIDRRAGGLGRVRDGDEVRHVHVDRVTDTELRFRWWREDGVGPVSAVRLTVEERDGGARLVVEEAPMPAAGTSTPVSSSTALARQAWWEQRLDRVAVRCAALVPA